MSLLLQFCLCVLIWGSTWLVITTQLEAVPPAWSIAYRFALAALLMHMMTFVTPQKSRIQPGQHLFLAGFGLCQFCINFLFVYEAERHVPSGLVAAAFALMVVANPILAGLILGQRQVRLVWVGGLVATLGVFLLFLDDFTRLEGTSASLLGLALAITGTVFASLGNVFPASRRAKHLSVFAMNSWGMTYGALGAACYAALTVGSPVFTHDLVFWGGLAYLAVFGSIIAFTCYLNVIKGWGMTRAGYSSVLIPIVALGLSSLFEGYRWTADAFVGAGLVVAGTIIALRGRARG
jgi:drug/metabolite transporter (DMT)-like permease